MDADKIIAEIECLERIFVAPDTRPLSPADLMAANRTARRYARAQSVVSSLAAVWCLLPSRVPCAATGRNRQLEVHKNLSTRTIKTTQTCQHELCNGKKVILRMHTRLH